MGGSSGCSTCIGIFKTLLNRSTFIELHKLLKSGRSGEQYPFLLLMLMNKKFFPIAFYLNRKLWTRFTRPCVYYAPVYDPADATAFPTHSFLASSKSRLVLPRLSWKGGRLTGVVVIVVTVVFSSLWNLVALPSVARGSACFNDR